MYLEQKRQNKISLTLLANAGPNPSAQLFLPKSNNKPTQIILDTPHIQDLTQKFENMTPIFFLLQTLLLQAHQVNGKSLSNPQDLQKRHERVLLKIMQVLQVKVAAAGNRGNVSSYWFNRAPICIQNMQGKDQL